MCRALALAVAAASMVAGCAHAARLASSDPAPTASSEPRLAFTDLTDDFEAAFRASEGRSPAEQLEQIDRAMAPGMVGYYDPARFGDRAAMYETMTTGFLKVYPLRMAAIADVAQRFGRMFDPAVTDFERRIGPLPTKIPVFLMVSMGEFDGATRTFGGQTRLLFGADMIAKLHGGEARAFVQHELFHIYHAEKADGCPEVWCGVWNEGLAVHASLMLNPEASDAELLLTVPEPIRPALQAHRKEAICAVRANLDSRDPAVRNALLSGGRLAPGLPPRFGYLVGLWIAQDLGRSASVAEMAQWQGPELRDRIAASLDGMADCP